MTKAPRPDTGTPSVADMSQLNGTQTMDTLHDPADIPPDPQAATPYFRRQAIDAAVEEIRPWYRGGPQAA